MLFVHVVRTSESELGPAEGLREDEAEPGPAPDAPLSRAVPRHHQGQAPWESPAASCSSGRCKSRDTALDTPSLGHYNGPRQYLSRTQNTMRMLLLVLLRPTHH